MEQKPQDESKQDTAFEPHQHINKVEKRETKQERDESGGSCKEVDEMDDHGAEKVKDSMELQTKFPNEKLSDREGKRYGSMAVWLLQNVKIT
ncbi:hypothetical protein HS088_TW07G00329 [Tripterygium wilfordii]|uniref:Uncharacterized protein n=1 Tax=Tripterygium wilfordii TaxID=458696 RepID=A0A7J7DEG3_TRIWF|nr:hypothetical protein HS088_TW07G00329 [Tripterygium wilfordii]